MTAHLTGTCLQIEQQLSDVKAKVVELEADNKALRATLAIPTLSAQTITRTVEAEKKVKVLEDKIDKLEDMESFYEAEHEHFRDRIEELEKELDKAHDMNFDKMNVEITKFKKDPDWDSAIQHHIIEMKDYEDKIAKTLRLLTHLKHLWGIAKPILDKVDQGFGWVPFMEVHEPIKKIEKIISELGGDIKDIPFGGYVDEG